MGGRERAGSFRVIRGPEVRIEGNDVFLREQTFEPVDESFGALEVATCYSGVACELIGVSSAPLSVTITAAETQRFARLKIRGGGGARRINTVLELQEPPTLRRQNRVRVAKNFLQLRSADGVVHVTDCFGDSPAGAGQLLDVSGAGDDFDLIFGRWIDQSNIGVL